MRGYAPRLSTTHLLSDILQVSGVEKARTLPPTATRPTLIRVTLESRTGTLVYTDFTIREAREWLASENR
jgi:hypothetical protein